MTIRLFGRCSVLFVLFAVLTAPGPALAGLASPASPESYRTTALPLTEASLAVQSWEKDGLLGADIQGRLEYPFARARETLTRPESWCEFLPLVFNIKSCTHAVRAGREELTFYVGRKFYEAPEDAFRLHYAFHVQDQDLDRFRILLFAAEGPYGTKEYRIEVEVREDSAGRVSLRMHSSFRPSLYSTLATRAYLATAGRDKVGFSIQGQRGGEPVYVDGTCGIIERNAMRYFLALKAHFETIGLAEQERLEARLHAWYDMTARYPRQLYEMDKEEYLDAKKREWSQQKQLQEKLQLEALAPKNRGSRS
jgi:hypothetical protein